MCGIVGIISKEPVAARLVQGAIRLQNRGEQSCGVFTFDGNFFYGHKELGPASVAFRNYDFSQLKGRAGIAHTRYATTGGDTPEKLRRNIQPVASDRPGMVTAANGDLVNLVSQTQKLRGLGFSFQTEVDAKVIQHTLASGFEESEVHSASDPADYANRIFKALERVNSELIGAFSVVNLLEKGLLVFKDPNGIRPLCGAVRRDNGNIIEYAFASESSVFNYFGDYHSIEELKPGEAIFVDFETMECFRRRIVERREAFCFFEFIYFARPDSRFKGRVVEVVRKEIGRVLAEEYQSLRDRLDVVIGVPATALGAAYSFALRMGLPQENAIIKVGTVRSFQETSDEKRKRAIDEKYIFVRDMIARKRVAIVDDSNVRGNTARKMVSRLFSLGAREVHYFFYSPPIIGPCFYGIDTPDEDELIAYNRTNEQIRELIGSTSVNYISIEGLLKGLNLPREELCLACLTRCYPTPIDAARERLALRRSERASW